MQLEIGGIYEGKVTGITKFGAFVDLGEGKTGMVHISEVAATFVKEIKDFVTEGQTVKVKVITIAPDGKISLSMKKAEPEAEKPKFEKRDNFTRPERKNDRKFERKFDDQKPERKDYRRNQENYSASGSARPGDFEWQRKPASGGSFEEMMSRFKATSDEKISDLKRNTETKRGGFSTRRGGDNHK